MEIKIVNIDRIKLKEFLNSLVLTRYNTKEELEEEIDNKTNLGNYIDVYTKIKI